MIIAPFGSLSNVILLAAIAALPFKAVAEDARPSLLKQAIARSGKNSNDRIINGTQAKYTDNPWQVALLWSGNQNNLQAQFCGGAMIGNRWIVTAAHCIDASYPPTSYEVLSGTDSLATGGARSKVARYMVHHSYVTSADGMQHDFDVALLEIDIKNGPPLRGAPIAGLKLTQDGAEAKTMIRITGWGVTEQRYRPTVNLLGIDLPYVSNQTCNAKKSYDGRITDNMLCAGEQDGGKDTCDGDSGGPATAVVDGARRLVGLVSWGVGCGDADMYGVYTRLTKFNDWIADTTNHEVLWN